MDEEEPGKERSITADDVRIMMKKYTDGLGIKSDGMWEVPKLTPVMPSLKAYTEKDVRFTAGLTQKLQAVEALNLKPMERPFEEDAEEKEQLPLGTVTYDSRYYGDYLFYDPKRIIQSYGVRVTSLPEHDTLIGTGLSGSLAVALIGHAYEKLFAVLRKEDAHSHSSRVFEGRIGTRWLFVDDFISSGKTKRRVLEKMKYHHPDVKYVGTWTYSRDEFTTSEL